jgi:hypothetical protein
LGEEEEVEEEEAEDKDTCVMMGLCGDIVKPLIHIESGRVRRFAKAAFGSLRSRTLDVCYHLGRKLCERESMLREGENGFRTPELLRAPST